MLATVCRDGCPPCKLQTLPAICPHVWWRTSRKMTTLRCWAKLSPAGWTISETRGIARRKATAKPRMAHGTEDKGRSSQPKLWPRRECPACTVAGLRGEGHTRTHLRHVHCIFLAPGPEGGVFAFPRTQTRTQAHTCARKPGPGVKAQAPSMRAPVLVHQVRQVSKCRDMVPLALAGLGPLPPRVFPGIHVKRPDCPWGICKIWYESMLEFTETLANPDSKSTQTDRRLPKRTSDNYRFLPLPFAVPVAVNPTLAPPPSPPDTTQPRSNHAWGVRAPLINHAPWACRCFSGA